MQFAGIFKLVDHGIPWINRVVIVNKKQHNKYCKSWLHICLDPFSNNQVIPREPLCNRTPEDIFGKLLQARMFTVVDIAKDTTTLSLKNLAHSYNFHNSIWKVQIHKNAFCFNLVGDAFSASYTQSTMT